MTAPSRVPLATSDDVANYIPGMDGKALAQLRYRGKGPKFVKLGQKVFYRWEDVYEWVDTHVQTRTDERTSAGTEASTQPAAEIRPRPSGPADSKASDSGQSSP